MGVVWKARQATLNRLVALQMVLGNHRAGAKELIRFLAEAEAVAAIKHPHVVQVFEYGDSVGRPFLAMEYLPGGSLTDRLRRFRRLDAKVAAKLVAALASVVQTAHDLGIVHRDLKPGNVLFDEQAEPKVTDFGLAKRTGGSDLTATQVVMGTPAYMPPEQARGDTKFVGPQADVYSLGVILYECLTGTRPFEAPDTMALLQKVVEYEPERPGKRVPGLPRDIELVCLKCLAKDPAERYRLAAALASDLGRFAAGESVSVRAPGVAERVARWARRKPTLAAGYAFGLLAVLLGGLGGVAVWQWRAAEGARSEAERQREKVERIECGLTIQVAYHHWRENNISVALSLLDKTRADFRGWEWRYVHRLCHLELPTFRGHSAPIVSASFSPDGSRVITRRSDDSINLWDTRNGAELLTVKGQVPGATRSSFNPDGSRVVTVSGGGIAKVWDARSGAELFILKGQTAIRSASFTRDGSRVVTCSGDGAVRVWDARSGAPVTLKGQGDSFHGASFSPDGLRAVASGDGVVRIWDARSGALFTLEDWFSPDGSRVVTASSDGAARVWDARSGADTRRGGV